MPYAAPGLHKARKAEIARAYRARKKHHVTAACPCDACFAKRSRPSAISATSVLKHRRIITGGAS